MSTLDNDQVGKIAEIQFDVDCARRNLFPAWPTIDKNGYDCIVDNGKDLIKVQVKSCSRPRYKDNAKQNPYYQVQVQKGKSGRDNYTPDCFDVLAVYLHSINVWYFIPFEEIENKCVKIYTKSLNSKYIPYRDNWQALGIS